MSFFNETTDMDLGITPIDNIFLNDYMPMANGTYVKVYLLGFKYASDKDYKIELTNKTIAKHLDISIEDVLNAWDFWEEKGIIKKEKGEDINYKVLFLNLKQLYIKNNLMNLKEKVAPQIKQISKPTPKDLIEANQIPIINKMFNNIDYMMRRQTTPLEKQQILGWIQSYNMNPDVIEKAFSYGVEKKGKRSINYVDGIIKNWYDMGLTNIEAVMEYFKTADEVYYRYERVMKALGLSNKGVTQGDLKLVNKWFDDYKFSIDLVLKACESSSKVQQVSVSYIDAIMNSWYEKGIKTVQDVETLDKKPEVASRTSTKQYPRKTYTHKTRFHNFEQRSSNYTAKELEEMAKRKREAYRMKKSGETVE